MDHFFNNLQRAKISGSLLIFVLTIITLFALSFFMLDCLAPELSFTNVFYILICVFVIFIDPQKSVIIYIALLCTFLLLLGSLVNHNFLLDIDSLVRRFTFVMVIWFVAWLGFINIRSHEEAFFSEKRFKIVFDSAPNALILVSHDTRIILANNQAKKMFFYEDNSLIGRKIENLIPERYHTSHHQGLARYFKAPEERFMGVGRDLKGLRSDGSEFPVEIGLNPVSVRENLYVLASIIDITDRKKMDEMRDHFSGILAHELRTPLAVVSGIVDNIHDGMEGPMSENQKQIIGIAKDNLDNLHDIINHLLMMTRFERGQYQVKFQKTDLTLHLQKIATGLSRLTQAQGIGMTVSIVEKLPPVVCDGALLKEVIYNIFSNALRHARQHIQLEAGIQANNPDWVYVVMRDDGPGMPKEKMKELFDDARFLQQDNKNASQHNGLGLGLPLCYGIMTAQKGKFWVENDKGCCVYLALPIA